VIHVQRVLQQTLYDAIAGDATIVQMVADRVFTNPPKGMGLAQEYPRIRIGERNIGDFSSHTHNGFNGYVVIHAWSQADNDVEVTAILERLYALLHTRNLGITTNETINFRCTENTVALEPDGKTFHGIQRYSLLLGGN
jgi:hypothetical protein